MQSSRRVSILIRRLTYGIWPNMLLRSSPAATRLVRGWFLTGEMMELIHSDVYNIVCIQPFACLPNHIVGKGVIKAIRKEYPKANIVAVDYDPGASEVNQLNRIKLMLSTANKNLKQEPNGEKDA